MSQAIMERTGEFSAAVGSALTSLIGWLFSCTVAIAGGLVAGWMIEAGWPPTRIQVEQFPRIAVTPIASVFLSWGAITYLGVAIIMFIGVRVESLVVRFILLLAIFGVVVVDTGVFFANLK